MSTLRNRLRASRSFFLTPGSRPERFAAARAMGGDAIIVDLESTVAPADKGRARDAALAFLREPPIADFVRIVRINSPRLVEGLRDLLALHDRDRTDGGARTGGLRRPSHGGGARTSVRAFPGRW